MKDNNVDDNSQANHSRVIAGVPLGAKVLIGILLGVIIFFIVVPITFDSRSPVNTVTSLQEQSQYELQLVEADLKTYGHLSSRRIAEYLQAIKEGYEEDKIPVGLTHAIACIESDYRFQIEHDRVIIPIHKVNTEVRAVGTGGIIWELWKDSLQAHTRAMTRADLFIPYDAIRSMTLILKILIRDEAKKGNTNLVDRVLIRYYGAYSSLYYDKTVKITSRLWMKRMNLYLNQIYETKK